MHISYPKLYAYMYIIIIKQVLNNVSNIIILNCNINN